jgi:hypothetical protein
MTGFNKPKQLQPIQVVPRVRHCHEQVSLQSMFYASECYQAPELSASMVPIARVATTRKGMVY